MNKLLLLLFLCFSHLLYAKIKVWAYKGNVEVIKESNVKLIRDIDFLQPNMQVKLTDINSYLVLVNLGGNTNQILELKGVQIRSYKELIQLFDKAPKLPTHSFISNDKDRLIFSGARQQNCYFYPPDINTYNVGDNDTITFVWQKGWPYQMKEQAKFFRVLTAFEDIIYEVPFEKNEHKIRVSGQVIKQHYTKLFKKELNNLIMIQVISPTAKEECKTVLSFDNQKRVIEKKAISKILLPEYKESLAYQMYAMLYAYQEKIYIEGFDLFEKLEKEFPKYKGFDSYHKPLYMYYINKEEDTNE